MIEHILEILASLGDKRNVVIYGKRLNRKIVKIAERLAGKIRKRMFLQVWMKDWEILEEEGFKKIGKVEWMEKVFT
ncbi:MAG: hypothetical protein J7J05_00285 [Thermococcus sp.]|uniref:hypothetical protein n=1 Tax=Thermococcus sp. TaxID=35749 RepID=UPI000F24DCCF|nr:hypothetical protein [Thermococcus sp.]RLF76017.1 MAG: hypothetical protein DRN51_02930 [Thermococci archaeon]MCD6139390.1 hypothetical protein [Thermococcus sp.]MCD6144148.1 hypothetical protein [Thermococcus sp.]RLF85642.1 MAG: hypothetical protein DRN48_02520 [Thermococci archaeon]RLF87158.1 MAG: hypothetical protein DRN41_00665 [Thermococci archaeon]